MIMLFGSLRKYRPEWLRSDLLAGLTVWAVLVPEALAYASIAGVSPVVGLYAAPGALLLYAALGSSRQLVTGPMAATAALSAATVGDLVAQSGGDQFLAFTTGLAIATGAAALVAGILRLGFLANFISEPVLKGFIVGLALTIVIGQVPKLFGVESGSGDFFESLWDLLGNLGETNVQTLVVGVLSLAVVLGLKHLAPTVPGSLVAVVLGIAAVAAFGLDDHGVAIVGHVESGLPSFGTPDLSLSDYGDLAAGGVGVMLVGFAEGLGAAKNYAARERREIDPNRELLGAWVSNWPGSVRRVKTIRLAHDQEDRMATAVDGQERLVEVEAVATVVSDRAPVGGEKTFRAYDPDQVLLMAPVLADWIPQGDLAHFVSDLVESGTLELSAICASYEDERGYPPYDPRLMVKLLVYGYANGVMSSRKLERATFRDVAVRMLCADQHPDYRSIARFRKRHLVALGELFVQALRLCKRARLVGLGSLALDGTKLRADASRHKAMSYERMVKKETRLEAEIAELRRNVNALLSEAERVDEQEDERFGPDRRGDDLPEELQRRESRLARIKEAKEALEAEAREAERARRAEMAGEGKKPRTPPNGRDPFAPKPTAQRNFTDPESKIMKTSDGSFHQCYNGQAVVDSETQVIVVAELSDQAPDAQQLQPALEQLDVNLQTIGAELSDDAVLSADGGYFSEENVSITAEHGLDPYIATGRFKHSEPPAPAPRGPVPKNATAKQRMARKLKTKKGVEIYKRRKAIVEPVFGQIGTVQDGQRVLIRGKPAARAQWRFECAIHNLLKLHRAGGLAALNTS